MRVQVYFQRFNDLTGAREGYDLVAAVNADPKNSAAQGGINGALEYAWVRTQNIFGSWSRGERFDSGEANEDYSPNVEVIQPLKVVNGKAYGHRSSMVGDVFVIDGVAHEVAGCGFKPAENFEADANRLRKLAALAPAGD